MRQEHVAELLYSLLNTIADPFFVIAEDGTYLEVFGHSSAVTVTPSGF